MAAYGVERAPPLLFSTSHHLNATTPPPSRRKPPSHERPYPMANRNATDELGAIVLGAIILIVVLTLVIAGYSALLP